jgi:hypothetical protein
MRMWLKKNREAVRKILTQKDGCQPDYHSRKRAAIAKINELVGKEVIIKSGRDQICGTVESEHDPPPEDCLSHTHSRMPLGLTDFILKGQSFTAQ